MTKQRQRQRFIVSQLLNTWVVRDTELLKKRKRSIVHEATTKDEAERACDLYNIGSIGQPPKVKAKVG